jgi:predicted metalloprotease
MRHHTPPLVLALTAVLALAGCGSSSSTTRSTTQAQATHTLAAARASTNAVTPTPADFKRLVRVHRRSGLSAHIIGLDNAPLSQAIQTLSNDLNQFWSGEFASSGVSWPPVKDVFVQSAPVQTGCAGGRASVGPSDPWYLCDGAGGVTFYWTLPWIQHNIATDPGNANLAINMAELWSFHVQNLFGFTRRLRQGKLSKGAWAEQTVCLTGVYVASLNNRQLLEQADVRTLGSFVDALASVNGIGSPDVNPLQLRQAFGAGLSGGQPGACEA